MPVYEYYCEPCNGVFELLRPARESSKAQPCPEWSMQGSAIRHPELEERKAPVAPTREEIEAAEYRRETKRRAFNRREPITVNAEEEQREQKLRMRMDVARTNPRNRRVTERFRAREFEEARKDRHKMEKGEDVRKK